MRLTTLVWCLMLAATGCGTGTNCAAILRPSTVVFIVKADLPAGTGGTVSVWACVDKRCRTSFDLPVTGDLRVVVAAPDLTRPVTVPVALRVYRTGNRLIFAGARRVRVRRDPSHPGPCEDAYTATLVASRSGGLQLAPTPQPPAPGPVTPAAG
ncbi:hypothetical protein GCM10023195_39830 [Actinoallomurus liliacearum]|uniref:Lipoprotein n=1 Tax=Actinoallomurus liliacearum TaxID=1080073 RepID=A0ABP8TLZ1_9ACTN